MKIRRLLSKPLVRHARKLLPLPIPSMIRNPLPGFDPHYYVYWYRDVLAFPGGAAAHYLQHGWREGRDPSAGFSTRGYLQANPDIAAADVNPLLHFVEFGLAEGRTGWGKEPGQPAPPPVMIEPPMKLLAPPMGA